MDIKEIKKLSALMDADGLRALGVDGARVYMEKHCACECGRECFFRGDQ